VAAEGEHILDLLEAAALDEALIVGPVVRHHEERGRVEAFDEEAALVVHRGVHRAADGGDVALLEPSAGGGEEGGGGFLIVDALEEAEEAAVFFVEAVVGVVEDGGEAADGLFAVEGEESLDFGVIVEGVMLVPDELLLILAERGHPVGVGAVDVPGELEKLFFLAAGEDGEDGGGHGEGFRVRGSERWH
jgi:hypothetical protein